MDTSNQSEDSLVQAHRDVQRNLGRCLVTLQLYERLLRRYLSACSSSFVVDASGQLRVEPHFDTDNKTLGQMMDDFKSKVVVDASRPDAGSAVTVRPLAEGEIVFSISNRIAFEPARYRETRRTLERLVAMRNELVHHLIEKFDLWSEVGCAAASAHLEECFTEVHAAYTRLRQFAESIDRSRAKLGEYLLSEEAAFAETMAASGTAFDWSHSSIVALLVEAASKFAVDGWTQLDRATDWITQRNAEETPERYGCTSWRQVVHESKCFDIKRPPSATPGRPRRAWYRMRQS